MSVDEVRGWNSVDNVLDRHSLHEDVALVVRPQHWVVRDEFKGLVRECFPLMCKNRKVALRVPPPVTEDELLRESLSRMPKKHRERLGH